MNRYWEKEAYIEDIERSLSATVGSDRLKDKRILITGASGLVGSYMSDVLVKAGASVFVAGRDIDELEDRFPRAKTLHYDLTEEIEFDEKFDYIIHGAGYGHPAVFVEDPVGVLTDMVNGTHRILEYALKHNISRVLYISSGEVYGGVDSMTPRTCYPLGKQASECLCASYTDKYDLDTVVCRLCHTFGPGISDKDNRAASQFIRDAVTGRDIVLKSEGKQRRSYLYVGDAVSAMLSVLSSGESGKAYDTASDECVTTIAELAGMIADVAGVERRFELPDGIDKLYQSPINDQVLDGSGLEQIGWKSAIGIKRGIEQVIEVLK